MNAPPISVVIPARNEAGVIGDAVTRLLQAGFQDLVVVDGGSGDATADHARSAGARVIAAPPGRAAQMNAGAAAARRENLLFLHADTRLPEGAAMRIIAALDQPQVAGGCFRLCFDRPHPVLAASAWFSRFDSYFTTFGDQAFFVRRSAFEAIGGFPEQPLMEDVAFRRRLRRHGPFVKLSAEVVTSARRYRRGVVRQQLLNGALLAAYALGARPQLLQRFYR